VGANLIGQIPAVHALDQAAAAYAAGRPDPIGAYHAYLAGALAALQQVRADLLAMPRPALLPTLEHGATQMAQGELT
jgi:hypothetical protein